MGKLRNYESQIVAGREYVILAPDNVLVAGTAQKFIHANFRGRLQVIRPAL